MWEGLEVLTLCASLHAQTALSAAILLAPYNTPPEVATPSALFLLAVSKANDAKSFSVKVYGAGLLASKTAAAEDVMTTEDS